MEVAAEAVVPIVQDPAAGDHLLVLPTRVVVHPDLRQAVAVVVARRDLLAVVEEVLHPDLREAHRGAHIQEVVDNY